MFSAAIAAGAALYGYCKPDPCAGMITGQEFIAQAFRVADRESRRFAVVLVVSTLAIWWIF